MTPITDNAGRFSPLKAATLLVLALPAAHLAFRAAIGDLGPLPVKEALLVCGLWAVRFLLLTLALTPAMRLLDRPRLALIRRMAGLAAFSYAALHLALYVVDSKYDLAFVAAEIASRIYLAIGFAALLGLGLLAATSTNAAIRRLGRRWKQLHRLVYAIAVLALLHFFMQSKIDASEATLMAGLFLLLMSYRLALRWRRRFSATVLAACGLGASLATALAEFLWYGLATGADPWRIAAANLMPGQSLRPAVIVLLLGLAAAAIPVLHAPRRVVPPARQSWTM